jgi:hypothetical protein
MEKQEDNMAFQIPGSVISLADQAKAAANAAAAAAQPSYADMLNTIKSGAIHKDTSESLGALSSVGVDTGSVSAMIEKAKASMGIDMAVAKAALAQKAKERQAAGQELTQEDKDAAMAPMAVLKNLQSTISSAMSSATAAISSHASTLGASLSGLNPTAALNSAGAALSSFTATIPAQTIPDPANPGQTMANPAYATFASANADKMSAVSSIASAASSAGASLTSAMSGFASAAASAKADTISTLKADAMLASLTKPMPASMASITGNNLNMGSIDKYAAIKAQEAPVKVVAESTADTTRPGTASLVSGMPTGSVSNENAARIWSYELSQLDAKLQAKRDAYFTAFGTTKDASKEDKQAALTAWIKRNLASMFPGGVTRYDQAVAIKNSKPDAATRTDEETAIYKQAKSEYLEWQASAEYIRVQKTLWGELDQYQVWYKTLYDTWIKGGSRFDLPADLLKLISGFSA